MNGQDDFLRRQEAIGESLNRTANHWNNQFAQLLGYLLGQFIRAVFLRGGIYMEMFLRRNFGVRYLPPLFSLVTTGAIGYGMYHSAEMLLLAPANDPNDFYSAGSLLIASILFAIPWTVHGTSVLWRYTSDNRDTYYPGDSWLDDLNVALQLRRGKAWSIPRWIMAWICATSSRRDFLGESVAGFAIAHLVGWLCFNQCVTGFLLDSLVLMQLKRGWLLLRGIKRGHDMNDIQWEMGRR